MNRVYVAEEKLARASDLPSVLEAAYAAFDYMLPLIMEQQDCGGGTFAAFVLAGSSAASGRLAIAGAPSLPASVGGPVADVAARSRVTAQEAGAASAGLSELLARRLEEAAVSAVGADRAACAEGARHARDLCARLGGALPR